MLDLSGWLTFFQYLAAVFGAFVVALWLGLIFWTYRDIRSRTPDRLIHALAALLAAVMGPLGYLIYLILTAAHAGGRLPAHAGGRSPAGRDRR